MFFFNKINNIYKNQKQNSRKNLRNISHSEVQGIIINSRDIRRQLEWTDKKVELTFD